MGKPACFQISALFQMSSQQFTTTTTTSTKQSISSSSPKPAAKAVAAGGGGRKPGPHGAAGSPNPGKCPTPVAAPLKPSKCPTPVAAVPKPAPPKPLPSAAAKMSVESQMAALAVSECKGAAGSGSSKPAKKSIPGAASQPAKKGSRPASSADMSVETQMAALSVSKGEGAAVQPAKSSPQKVQSQPKGAPRPKSGQKVSPPANSVAASVAKHEKKAQPEQTMRDKFRKLYPHLPAMNQKALEAERAVASMYGFLKTTYGDRFLIGTGSDLFPSFKYKDHDYQQQFCYLDFPINNRVFFRFYMDGMSSFSSVSVGAAHQLKVYSLDDLKNIIEALSTEGKWREFVDKRNHGPKSKLNSLPAEVMQTEGGEHFYVDWHLNNPAYCGQDGGKMVFILPEYEFTEVGPCLDDFVRSMGPSDDVSVSFGGVTRTWDMFLFGPVVTVTRDLGRDEFTVVVLGYGKNYCEEFKFRYASSFERFTKLFLDQDIIRLRRLLYGGGSDLSAFRYSRGEFEVGSPAETVLPALAGGLGPMILRFSTFSSSPYDHLVQVLGVPDYVESAPRRTYCLWEMDCPWEGRVGKCEVMFESFGPSQWVVEFRFGTGSCDVPQSHSFSMYGCFEFFMSHISGKASGAIPMDC